MKEYIKSFYPPALRLMGIGLSLLLLSLLLTACFWYLPRFSECEVTFALWQNRNDLFDLWMASLCLTLAGGVLLDLAYRKERR